MESSKFRCYRHASHNSVGICAVCLTKRLLQLMLEKDEYIESALLHSTFFDHVKSVPSTMKSQGRGNFNSTAHHEQNRHLPRKDFEANNSMQYEQHNFSHGPSPSHDSCHRREACCYLRAVDDNLTGPKIFTTRGCPTLHNNLCKHPLSNGNAAAQGYRISYNFGGDQNKRNASSLWTLLTNKRAQHIKERGSKKRDKDAVLSRKTKQNRGNAQQQGEISARPSTTGFWLSSFLPKKGKNKMPVQRLDKGDHAYEDAEWLYGRHSLDQYVPQRPFVAAPCVAKGDVRAMAGLVERQRHRRLDSDQQIPKYMQHEDINPHAQHDIKLPTNARHSVDHCVSSNVVEPYGPRLSLDGYSGTQCAGNHKLPERFSSKGLKVKGPAMSPARMQTSPVHQCSSKQWP